LTSRPPLDAPPLVIAHRAGNDLRLLRTAESARIGLVEADVHLFRGRLEVRHLKTLGPVPVYWDRWRLPLRFSPRLYLPQLCDALDPSTVLLLDLKGRARKLPAAVLAALQGRPAMVCSRNWAQLEPFRGVEQVRVVYSVGSRRQLAALHRRFMGQVVDGISIHERLLDRTTAAEVLKRAELVMTWPVNTLERARELLSWGVRGLITDSPGAIQAVSAA
jgi:glycerophosphoryl diester phosphodiesterase